MKKEEIIKNYLHKRCRITFFYALDTIRAIEGKIIFVVSSKDADENTGAINVLTDKNESLPMDIQNIISIDIL